ncbi:carbohydrate ABC transporter membrane protein 2 (CUT1 family) [Motilibacter rhizosphaerae]|uniref:Carbohydrate ABC transporter membrane protein 2 (CUT1 family) n=1 Tax=Motilibacter rhizosphaerae TaxID=598652 RepID=A0A4Q7NYG0_9ACTN|nr:carbohydrate ABC transporter permease [Motilibacter rhizosphaerae]RZS91432.1 carbohydrate ABC transporter membrane protein 2 (CUT1 family) [Motilibacter rhizosphaerae]
MTITSAPSRRRPLSEPRTRLAHTLMAVGVLYFAVPLVWIVIAATKSQPDLLSTPALSFSTKFNLFSNLHDLFAEENGIYGRWLLNTALYAGGGAVGATVLSALAGYGLARFSFPGKQFFESALLGMVMVPATALVLPTYLLLSHLHLVDTVWAVILPSLLSPFGTYLVKVYVDESVPSELLEAARIDRAGEFRIFRQVALPMMRPAVVTVFLFSLVAIWNNYFLPLVMLSNERLYPLTVGLTNWFNTAQQAGGTRFLFNLVVTGSLVAILPLVVAFVLLQRFWQSGVSTGALK